jgi:hypothetical protein
MKPLKQLKSYTKSKHMKTRRSFIKTMGAGTALAAAGFLP